jgi:hypothetical protein
MLLSVLSLYQHAKHRISCLEL